MITYYQVTCQHVDVDDKGKAKRITERYLVNAASCTEAEALTHKAFGMNVNDFEVKEVKKSRIIDVYDDPNKRLDTYDDSEYPSDEELVDKVKARYNETVDR
tara:strand:- start:1193 stop:1498 length:306 start_codon:yes stop_codon:yes gene_type:complete